MCGRFSLIKTAEEIEERFGVSIDKDFYRPVYNAAPSMKMAVITNNEPGKINFYRWGLVPFWAKDVKIGYKMINARAETLLEKPAFRSAFKTKRCLVISDGFYEWKKDSSNKIPYRITLKNNSLYAYAGLWDQWKDAEAMTLSTFTIITTSPNYLMSNIHDRMPVILEADDERKWLDQSAGDNALLEMLRPYQSERMNSCAISSLVNNPRNNSEEILTPISL
jgi:putative SOS response-associated peptidase YedK